MDKEKVDINALLIKPIYIGLLLNALVPVGLLSIAYLKNPTAAKAAPAIPESLEMLFWVFIALAVIDGAIAIILKQKLFFSPMIKSAETFSDDMIKGVANASIICNALTAAITVFGFIYYLLGGTFNQLLFFVIMSVVSYQIVRPRLGFIQKVIDKQVEFAEQGNFKTD